MYWSRVPPAGFYLFFCLSVYLSWQQIVPFLSPFLLPFLRSNFYLFFNLFFYLFLAAGLHPCKEGDEGQKWRERGLRAKVACIPLPRTQTHTHGGGHGARRVCDGCGTCMQAGRRSVGCSAADPRLPHRMPSQPCCSRPTAGTTRA